MQVWLFVLCYIPSSVHHNVPSTMSWSSWGFDRNPTPFLVVPNYGNTIFVFTISSYICDLGMVPRRGSVHQVVFTEKGLLVGYGGGFLPFVYR